MSLSDFQSAWGLVGRDLPAMGTDENYKALRIDRRGALYTQPSGAMRQALAAQGTYWVAHNNTNDASTTLAGHAAPVLADADAPDFVDDGEDLEFYEWAAGEVET